MNTYNMDKMYESYASGMETMQMWLDESEQENKQLKDKIDKAIEYITIYRSYEDIDGKDYLKGRDEIGTLSLSQIDKLLDILKEVE